MANITETPLMKQYREMKAEHPDAVLLYRVGDFYETFGEDAIIASEILGVTLTRRANGSSSSIELAGFPHHALDEYLPKLVRAGKRVAICESTGDNKPTEVITPTATATTTAKPKQEPKPNKTMKTIKRKDTIIENVKYLEEEPFAWLTLRIPKDAKDCGKCADKNNLRPTVAVMVEPDANKMVVTNTHILHAYDVECKGAWPKDRNTPFQFYIEPKDVARLAGQEVDVAVWKAEVGGRKTEVATCEVVGTVTECDYKGKYPNWQRVMPSNDGWKIDLGCSTESELNDLRKWVKNYIGSNKKERENRRIVLTALKGEVIELEAYEAEYATSDTLGERLGGYTLNCDAPINLKMMFNAELFYYSILPDFDGSIWVTDATRPAKFCGKQRESVLMPLFFADGYCTDSDNVETVGQRQKREYEEQKERERREQEEERLRKEYEDAANKSDNQNEDLTF